MNKYDLEQVNCYAESNWQGSCYGMTVSELLVKEKTFNLSKYNGNSVVNKNTATKDMISVINFIQVSQLNGDFLQTTRYKNYISSSSSQEDAIKNIESIFAKSNNCVNICYWLSRGGGHSVLAYGIENYTYKSNVTGITYDKRILIADPNFTMSNKVNDSACIYYRSSDKSWIVPYWNNSTRTCYWTANKSTKTGSIGRIEEFKSLQDYINQKTQKSTSNYIAGLTLYDTAEENYTITKDETFKGTGTKVPLPSGSSGQEIIKYNLDLDDGLSDNHTENYSLWDAKSAYVLKYNTTSSTDLKMDYDGIIYYADASKVNSATFSPYGSIKMNGSNSTFDLTMLIDDNKRVNDWYSVNVSGNKMYNLEYKKVSDGYLLSSTSLNGVKVTTKSDDKDQSITFSTTYKSVLICENSDGTISVKVDKDKNGTYETMLSTKTV